jgi:hypothetical protein
MTRSPAIRRAFPVLLLVLPLCSTSAAAQEVRYGTGTWTPDSLGNHRVVLRVDGDADAVAVHIPWRRRDADPDRRETIIVDGRTGARVANVARIEVTRAYGDFAFQPVSGAGQYYAYYLPYIMEGRANYPTVTYPEPVATASMDWLRRHGLTPEARAGGAWRDLPRATAVEIQSVDAFNSFYPMEVIATADEVAALVRSHSETSYLLFPEDRSNPIRMTTDLPIHWIERGPGGMIQGAAGRGEFYAFQVGVYALRPIRDLSVTFSDLRRTAGLDVIAASAFSSFNTGGVDSFGERFTKTVSVERGKVQALWFGVQVPQAATPGTYAGELTIAPVGEKPTTLPISLRVSADPIPAAGDNEPWRHSRLRWLDSRIALDDQVVAPFTPVEVDGNRVRVLGRRVTLGRDGFPTDIESFFAYEMTHVGDAPRRVLSAPVRMVVEDAGGNAVRWEREGLRYARQNAGVAVWDARNVSGSLVMDVHGAMEFDGNIEFRVALQATEGITLDDVRLEIPIAADVARYMMGMGYRGGFRPAAFDWRWQVEHNQDGAWIGDVNAGLQFSMRDDRYVRPLNTNFYLRKPLIMPASWDNGGRGGCRMAEERDAFIVRCFSGRRTMQAGEVQHYDFRLALTPFKPIDTDAQWHTRFYHRFTPVDSIAVLGANTVNVHHANRVNPFINYPFIVPDEMKAYVDSGHALGMKVKIYYTVRELTNRAAELFALRSLGDEILAYGPGGGPPWLQEHLDQDYIAGWYVPRLKDAAVINSGVSRWHNYYLEGLNWLVQNVGIDGLYIDDVAFDRTTMKRVRKILDRGGPGKLIDLHSANQFNVRDGFANSANLYLEHFPYINRLWFGEYFDYDSRPDFWMTELAGIPFGLMGEMLQDGGNPWRGMLYGMTARLPWAGDPTPLWRVWDEFGIDESRMVGYWVPDHPVVTGHPDVLATAYIREGRTLVSLASWAEDTVDVRLDIDWDRLGIDPRRAVLTAPAIRAFQDATSFAVGEGIPVAPGRGWLLIVGEQR